MIKNILPTAVAVALTLTLTAGFSTSANAALADDAVLYFADSSLDRTCLAYPDAADPSGCAFGAYDDVTVGSFFAMDTDGSGVHEAAERTMVVGAGNGITMGIAQAAGSIDSWSFFGAPGYHFTSAAPTVTSDDGAGNATTSMNWWVNWNGGNIDMSAGADAVITCGNTCEYRDTFTLDYSAIVPASDPSFGGVFYALHLEGVISCQGQTPEGECYDRSTDTYFYPYIPPAPIPVPAAVWLFGSGLIGLVGVAKRKKA